MTRIDFSKACLLSELVGIDAGLLSGLKQHLPSEERLLDST